MSTDILVSKYWESFQIAFFNLESLFEDPLKLHSSVELHMMLLLNIIWWDFRLFQDHNKKVKVYLDNYPTKLPCYRKDRPEIQGPIKVMKSRSVKMEIE